LWEYARRNHSVKGKRNPTGKVVGVDQIVGGQQKSPNDNLKGKGGIFVRG